MTDNELKAIKIQAAVELATSGKPSSSRAIQNFSKAYDAITNSVDSEGHSTSNQESDHPDLNLAR